MTERSSAGLDERRRRLLFRAWRRGVREMDLIVGRFADVYIDQFDEPTLDDFEQLIEVPNADLYAWIVGNEAVPANHDTLVLRQLIAFHNRTGAEPGPKSCPRRRACCQTPPPSGSPPAGRSRLPGYLTAPRGWSLPISPAPSPPAKTRR